MILNGEITRPSPNRPRDPGVYMEEMNQLDKDALIKGEVFDW